MVLQIQSANFRLNEHQRLPPPSSCSFKRKLKIALSSWIFNVLSVHRVYLSPRNMTEQHHRTLDSRLTLKIIILLLIFFSESRYQESFHTSHATIYNLAIARFSRWSASFLVFLSFMDFTVTSSSCPKKNLTSQQTASSFIYCVSKIIHNKE